MIWCHVHIVLILYWYQCNMSGVLDSARTWLPCYQCCVTRDDLDGLTQYPLRSKELTEYHVRKMRRILTRHGKTAMTEYSKYQIDISLISSIWTMSFQYPFILSTRLIHCCTGSGCSVAMVESVFRRFLDFDPHTGTPLDLLHNMESGVFATLLTVPKWYFNNSYAISIPSRYPCDVNAISMRCSLYCSYLSCIWTAVLGT